jgi:DNA polymerase-3 subunit beta
VKFRVEREVMGEAVSWVARALPTRPVVPVLSGLLVQADERGLTLSCFDYEVSARVVVPAEVGEPGTAVVPGRLLAEITRSLPPAPVQVTSAADMLMLTCGSAEFALVCLALDEYPKLPELPQVVGTVDGGALSVAAAQVVPSASRDDTLPMLTGVCLDFAGSTITLAATDRYRLGVSTISWAPADDSISASALVPARTLADIAKTMGPGMPVTIAFSQPGAGQPGPADGMISFEGGGRRLTARLIGGDFIKYQSRFPAEFGSAGELPAGPFTEAVRRVSLVADRASPVLLSFRPDRVVIEARSDGRARAVESVRCQFTGAEQVISFNPHYLLDGLAAAAMSEHGRPASAAPAGDDDTGGAAQATGRIRLEFTSAAKPALITWADGGEPGPDDQPTSAAPAFAGTGGHLGEPSTDPGGSAGAGHPAGRTAGFRYLVVPLRAPAGADRG